MTTENVDIRVREDGSRVVSRNLESIGASARRSADGVDFLKRTLRTVAAAFGVHEVLQMADAYTTLHNRLRATGLEGNNLNAVYRALLVVSNDTLSSLKGTVEMYSRMALSSKELGVSQSELISFTKSLNQAIILSGASVVESNAALIQLSQGMASGKLSGDELRSVLEQLPAVADVIAKSMGVTRGELRKLGAAGTITPQVILKAFREARTELEQNFAKAIPTISQSFQVLKNNFLDFVGRMNESTGASKALSQLLLFLANNIDTVAMALTAMLSGLILVGGSSYLIRGVATAFTALNAAIVANPIGALAVVLVTIIGSLTVFRDRILLGIDSVTTLGDFMRAFGEVAQRVFNSIAGWAEAAFGPLINLAKEWLKSVDFSVIGVIRGVAKAVDVFVALWRGAVYATVAIFEGVPPAVADIFTRTLNFILDKIGKFINAAGALLNTVAEFAGLGKIAQSVDFKLTNENAGAAKRLGGDIAAAFSEGFNQEGPASKFVSDLEKRAKTIGDQRRAAQTPTGSVSDVAGTNKTKTVIDEKGLKRAEDALRSLLNTIQPSSGAILELAKAERVLDEAQKRGLITKAQNVQYLELARKYYEDIINPLGKINREVDEEIKLLGVANREREVETQLLRIKTDMQRVGLPMDQAQIEAMRTKLQLLRDTNEMTQAQDSLLANSVDQRRAFTIQLEAINKLLANPTSGFTKGDAASAVNALAPELFAGTQTAIDANIEAHRVMYERIDQLRASGLISEETAAAARIRIWQMSQQLQLQTASKFFGDLAGLQESGNKKIAAIGKAAAIAQTLVKTYESATAAYAAMAGIPVVGPALGAAAAAGAIATGLANVAAIRNTGYEKGGYTGDFGKSMPAGIVHGQEFVVNAEATAQYRDLLERMNAGSLSGSTPTRHPQANATAAPVSQSSSEANGVNVNQRIINVIDPKMVEDYLSSPQGEQVFVNMIRKNSDSIRSVISDA